MQERESCLVSRLPPTPAYWVSVLACSGMHVVPPPLHLYARVQLASIPRLVSLVKTCLDIFCRRHKMTWNQANEFARLKTQMATASRRDNVFHFQLSIQLLRHYQLSLRVFSK